MAATGQSVLITGVAGNLGTRLLPMLADFSVIGADMHEPPDGTLREFHAVDLGEEDSCTALVEILRQHRPFAVVHLAFVIDPVRNGVLDLDRMWRINVAGTARVVEAIAESNRMGGAIRKFIHMSSVSAYGPETPFPVPEDYELNARTLPYALHKEESDEVVRLRAPSLGECTTYVLRPHIFTGATMQNYLVGALRGTPGGVSQRAERMRERGKRLPMLLPYGDQYPAKLFQFVHVDDVARLISYILRREERSTGVMVLNVAGRGDPVSIGRAAELAGSKVVRLPSVWLCRMALKMMWNRKLSAVPPEALPYMIGSYLVDTKRLKWFLGDEYEKVIRYTVEEALADSFVETSSSPALAVTSKARV